MNISPVISSQIRQAGFFNSDLARPVVYSFNAPESTSTSIVDISMPGKSLSMASIFNNDIAQPVATNSNSFASIVDTAQRFVDVFNSFLQSGSDNLQYLSGGSLSSTFLPVLDSQATVATGNEKSIITRLADVGINYQAPSILSETGQMTVDIKSLQSAFIADPIGLSALLMQGIQYIASLATAAISGTLANIDSSPTLATDPNATPTAILTAAETKSTIDRITPPASEINVQSAQTSNQNFPTAAVAASTPIQTNATVDTGIIVPTMATWSVVNPLTIATDPATAAAIAAYHLVDGVFDTGMPHVDGLSTASHSYSEILAVAKIRPIALDYYA